MDQQRFVDWTKTADALQKGALLLLGIAVAAWGATGKAVTQAGGPRWLAEAASALVVAFLAFLLFQSYRSFVGASRLLRPDAFALRATGPENLIGRQDDLDRLVSAVKNNRLVLLDGESGCGKSALVSAGLVPTLSTVDGLVPVLIRDYRDDWVRSPLSAALDATFGALSTANRERIKWTTAPDLAADAPALATELNLQINAISAVLRHRVVLIVDQFDDYQAAHRAKFLDEEGNWIAPDALLKVNPFWEIVARWLAEEKLHLVVVTRSDTAAGLTCVRFVRNSQTTTRTVQRVETDYLGELLSRVAPPEATPPVVSNPNSGWVQLREQLEKDLKAEGSILMQQVRTALLGLRQLDLLTLSAYTDAGGVRGLERLVISKALVHATGAGSGEGQGLAPARSLLKHLTFTSGANVPKARASSLSELLTVVSPSERLARMLQSFQQDELVRPADVGGGEEAWQLDHDYLARGILSEAKQAGFWDVLLMEGTSNFREAGASLWRRWAALLTIPQFAQVLWERVHRRIVFDGTRSYVLLSGLKPLGLALLVSVSLGLSYAAKRDSDLTFRAAALSNRFGLSDGPSFALEVWQSSDEFRDRVYELVVNDSYTLERAVNDGWLLAHATAEPKSVVEALAAYRKWLANGAAQPRGSWGLGKQGHTALLSRLADTELLEETVNVETDLCAALGCEPSATQTSVQKPTAPSREYVDGLVALYEDIWSSTTSSRVAKSHGEVLRREMLRAEGNPFELPLARAYGSVAAHFLDEQDVFDAAREVRRIMERHAPADWNSPGTILSTYGDLVGRLSQEHLKNESDALWEKVRTESATSDQGHEKENLLYAFGFVTSRVTSQEYLIDAAQRLRHRIESVHTRNQGVEGYASVAAGLTAEAAVRIELEAMRRWADSNWGISAASMEMDRAYAALLRRVKTPQAVMAEVSALRRLVVGGDIRSPPYLNAYQKVMDDKTEEERAAEGRSLRADAGGRLSKFSALWELAESWAPRPLVNVPAIALRVAREKALKEIGTVLLSDSAEEYLDLVVHLPAQARSAEAEVALAKLPSLRDEEASGMANLVSHMVAKSNQEQLGRAAALIRGIPRPLAPQFRNPSGVGPTPSDEYYLAKSYARVAAQLTDSATIAREMAEINLPSEGSSEVFYYGAVEALAPVSDPVILHAKVRELREFLRRAAPNKVGRWSGTLAKLQVERLKRPDSNRKETVRSILIDSLHPFMSQHDMVQALTPLSGGLGFVATRTWAAEKYGVTLEQLRPSPVPGTH